MEGNHASAEAKLRVLRQGPGTTGQRRADLQLRVYFLRRLCRARAAQRLSELWRRLRAATDSPVHRKTARRLSRAAPGIDKARPPEMGPCRSDVLCRNAISDISCGQ